MLQWKRDNIDNIFSLQNQNVTSRNTTWNSENTRPSYTKVFTTKHKVGKEKHKRISERRE